MEEQDTYDTFLKTQMSVHASNIVPPDMQFLNEARKKISKRRIQIEEREDFFSAMAAFLNLKIKLYHAVLASVLVALCIFYFTKSNKTNNIEAGNSQYVSNIAAVRNNTVLSSIRTFAIKN